MSKNLSRMTRFRWHAVIVIVLELALATAAAAQIIGEWSTFMDGTRQTAIAAEGDARLWVTSTAGAMGFTPDDSTTVRLFRNDGLPSQDMTAVAIDAAGNRWFGSRGRGLQVVTPEGTFLLRPLDRFDLGSDSVRVLIAVEEEAWGDSTVWVGTESGAALVTYPPDSNRPDSAVLLTFNIRSLLGERPLVNAIAVRDSTAWFGTERGVVRLTTSGARSIENDGLTDLDVHSLIVFEDSLWAGTASRVFRLEGGQWVERSSGLALGRSFLSFAVFEGALHVGVDGTTTPVYRLGGLDWAPRGTGLANFSVTGLAVARGRLWAATRRDIFQGGLFVLDLSETWSRIPSPDPPSPGFADFDPAYLSVAAVPGTQNGRANTRFFAVGLDESGWSWVKVGEQGIETTQLSRMLVDQAGRSWLAHCCCGTGSSCRCDRLDDLSGGAVAFGAFDIINLALAPNGDVWLASVRSGTESPGFGLYRVSGANGAVTRFIPSGSSFPLSSLSIEALAFDGSGRLWIGHTEDGVDVWTVPGDTRSPLIHLDFAQGLPSLRVTSLAAAGDHAWVGTVTGIAVFEGTLLERVIRGDALPDPLVNDLAFDGCGRAWVATDAGVSVFDGQGTKLGEYTDDPATWPGVADQRVNAIDVEPATGTIWFATQNGLSRFVYDLSCGSSTAGGAPCTRLCPFPNPYDPAFDPELRITGITDLGAARVTVFDALGNRIAERAASPDGTVWDGRDAGGAPAASGVYLVKIEGGGEVIMRRLAVLR